MYWPLVFQIALAVIPAVVAALVTHALVARPRLVAYFGHVGSFRLRALEGPDTIINSHTVVVKNAGRRAAKNVRLRHNVLPDHFDIQPSRDYRIIETPDKSKQIWFESLVPGETVWISYLYHAPLTFTDINKLVLSEEGIARQINMIPARAYSRIMTGLIRVLSVIGLIALLYVVALAAKLSI